MLCPCFCWMNYSILLCGQGLAALRERPCSSVGCLILAVLALWPLKYVIPQGHLHWEEASFRTGLPFTIFQLLVRSPALKWPHLTHLCVCMCAHVYVCIGTVMYACAEVGRKPWMSSSFLWRHSLSVIWMYSVVWADRVPSLFASSSLGLQIYCTMLRCFYMGLGLKLRSSH